MSGRAFPVGGRRAVVYQHDDPRGEVEEHVTYLLARLRPHADRLVVVVGGDVDDAGLARLAAVADAVVRRGAPGYDTAGFRAGIAALGPETTDFDELVLTGSGWYGPVNPFATLFGRMDSEEVDFWSITEALDERRPAPEAGRADLRVEGYWMAFRRSVLEAAAWRDLWSGEAEPMPVDAPGERGRFESRLTATLEAAGFTRRAAYPLDRRFPKERSLADAVGLIEEGAPSLRRSLFALDPRIVESTVVRPRLALDAAGRLGFPIEMIERDLVRRLPPRTVGNNLGMFEILPDAIVDYDAAHPLRIAVLAHIFYPELTDELLQYCAHLPSDYDLYVTTSDEGRAGAIRARLGATTDPRRRDMGVRVLESNRGRDMSAFLIGMRDVLLGGDHDLVIKLHSKRSTEAGYAAGEFFRWHCLTNLLGSPGYAANLVARFQQDERLGLVYPTPIHTGTYRRVHGWMKNRPLAEQLCEELGIRVPLDEITPLAPYGSMFVARPEALRLLLDAPLRYEDYPVPPGPTDGGLGHAQERIFSYAAAELGYLTRTVATAEYAAFSHASLDHELQELKAAAPQTSVGPVRYFKLWLRRRHPRAAKVLRTPYRVLRRVVRLGRR